MAIDSSWDKLKSVNSEFADSKYFKDVLDANGLFSRSDIDIYNNIYRYGKFDPYGALQNTKEYLFFTKPDLHIMNGKTGNLNSELQYEPFFIELLARYPKVIEQLQASADKSNNPFCLLLSNNVASNLDVPGMQATTIDNPTNIYGTSYEYIGSSEASDDNFDFSLEFKDTKYLDTYMFFKAYNEYQILKRHGRVSPPDMQKYTVNKVLHDQIGIYKIVVDSDYKNIIYYAYYCGVMFKSLPRDVFSGSEFNEGLRYSIDLKAAFVEDMNPLILRDFNILTENFRLQNTSKNLEVFDVAAGMISGTPAKSAFIKNTRESISNRARYQLIWRR